MNNRVQDGVVELGEDVGARRWREGKRRTVGGRSDGVMSSEDDKEDAVVR